MYLISANHSDLHSFPTRRSSDLIERLRVPAPARAGLALPSLIALQRKQLLELLSALLGGGDELGLVLAVRRHGLDRKSTRLNSSHRCISYAVFCLKKKINALYSC